MTSYLRKLHEQLAVSGKTAEQLRIDKIKRRKARKAKDAAKKAKRQEVLKDRKNKEPAMTPQEEEQVFEQLMESSPPEEETETTAPEEVKDTETSESAEAMLNAMTEPQLLLINKLKGEEDNYESFLQDLNKTKNIKLLDQENIKSFIVDKSGSEDIINVLQAFGILYEVSDFPKTNLTVKNPFEQLDIKMGDINVQEIKNALAASWAKLVPSSQEVKIEKNISKEKDLSAELKKILKIKNHAMIIINPIRNLKGEDDEETEERLGDWYSEMEDEITECVIFPVLEGFVLIGSNIVIGHLTDQLAHYDINHEDIGLPDVRVDNNELSDNPFEGINISPATGYSPKEIRKILTTNWKKLKSLWTPEAEKETKEGVSEEKTTRGDNFNLIKRMKHPALYVIKVPEDKKEDYAKFIQENAEIKKCVNLANADNLYGWLFDLKDNAAALRQQLDTLGLENEELTFPVSDENKPLKGSELLEHAEPFKDIKIDGDANSRLLNGLAKAWDAVKSETAKEKEDEFSSGTDHEGSVQLKRILQLQDPHIVILNPLGMADMYAKALSDSKRTVELRKAIHFADSRQFTDDGQSIKVYFAAGNHIQAIENEIKNTLGLPQYSIMPVKEDFFKETQPFHDMTINDKTFGKKIDMTTLNNELDLIWTHHSEDSGQRIPAIEMSNLIPLDFTRFLNKKQRPIQMYIGNMPKGAGNPDMVYVLAEEYEATAFKSVIQKLNFPSLFYQGMYFASDIDVAFKQVDPREITPANALILEAKDTFKPKDIIEPTEDNMELYKAAARSFDDEKLNKLNAELKKIEDALEEDSLTHKLDDQKKEALVQSKKDIEETLENEAKRVKVTQLGLLHAFAKFVLGNRTGKPGAFVASKWTIGTHVAQFGKDMSYCILWGSQTKHVTLDTEKTLKQLPFVKKLITSYL